MGHSGLSVTSESTDAALILVNHGRHALNLKPLGHLPRGVPGKAQTCVLGRALSLRICQDHDDRYFALLPQYTRARRLAAAWRTARPSEAWDGWSVYLPGRLNNFVRDFDALHYPEYLNFAAAAKIGFPSELRLLKQSVRRFIKWSGDRHLTLSVSCDDARVLCDASRTLSATSRMLCASSRTLCASSRTLCDASRRLCDTSKALINRSRRVTAEGGQIDFGLNGAETVQGRPSDAARAVIPVPKRRPARKYAIAS
jgi:hypothetical protein